MRHTYQAMLLAFMAGSLMWSARNCERLKTSSFRACLVIEWCSIGEGSSTLSISSCLSCHLRRVWRCSCFVNCLLIVLLFNISYILLILWCASLPCSNTNVKWMFQEKQIFQLLTYDLSSEGVGCPKCLDGCDIVSKSVELVDVKVERFWK